jgi:hypothetical protein
MSEQAREREPHATPRKARRNAAATETTQARLLTLQAEAGNRAVGRLLARVPTQININRPEPRTRGRFYSGRARYEVDFTPFECMLTIRVRLVPDSNVTAAETDTVKAEAEREFLRLWDNKFYLDETVRHRLPGVDPRATTTDRFFLRVRVLWVTRGEHVRIQLSRGPGHNNEKHWFTGSVPTSRAHELSHTLASTTSTSTHRFRGGELRRHPASSRITRYSATTTTRASLSRKSSSGTGSNSPPTSASPRAGGSRPVTRAITRANGSCAGAAFATPPRREAPSGRAPRRRCARSSRI